MREIKFRAWLIKENEMIPVRQIDFESQIINSESAWRFFEEAILMQSTELLDKNGTEIYEDDVVSNGVFVAVVEYCDGWYFPFGNSDTCLYSDEVEVIGNIHDNPELLQ